MPCDESTAAKRAATAQRHRLTRRPAKHHRRSLFHGHTRPTARYAESEEMALDEIINGKGDYFPGLVPLVCVVAAFRVVSPRERPETETGGKKTTDVSCAPGDSRGDDAPSPPPSRRRVAYGALRARVRYAYLEHIGCDSTAFEQVSRPAIDRAARRSACPGEGAGDHISACRGCSRDVR